MNSKTVLFILLVYLVGQKAYSQPCTVLGQNPATAFPVCGTNVFSQNNVPLCGNRTVPGIGCGSGLSDKNPFWYKFTAFTSGTLGFLITPNQLSDDYDWQLYDITGRNPDEVYTVSSLIVGSNWSGEPGLTGASSAGKALNVCEGTGQALFSSMPTVVSGHEYLLLISHFTETQSGYKLSFGGGTASITDTKPPELDKVTPACDATTLTVTLNKKMRCNSLAANGSDFQLSSPLASITAASGGGCSNGFDMQTITLTLNKRLPPGNYRLIAKNGGDGNTILDYCGANIPAATEVSFKIEPPQPTLMDSLVPVQCAPANLKLVFSKPIKCNSIAQNGSDFIISGPTSVTIAGASGECDPAGLTKVINVRLSGPIQTAGNYQLNLVNGNDLNTLEDECGMLTPLGSSLNMSIKDTVSADFSYQVMLGCKTDTIAFSHDGRNGVHSWAWMMGDNKRSQEQQPTAYYTLFGEKQVRLIVSNDFCADTVTRSILLDNAIDAKIISPEILCPAEYAHYEDGSSGKINTWNWQFGNGFTSTDRNPSPQQYEIPRTTREVKHKVSLVIGNELGCYDTATVILKAVSSCYIAVPSAFTPNQDGINDYLYPLNAFKATNLKFRVYNRYGQVVFETSDWTKKWDGRIDSKPQPSGIYIWTLVYTDADSGKIISAKGTSALIR
jgi:gliding motility-associated-like protein